MSCLFNFLVFKVQMVENCASINVGEIILNLPANVTKYNQGYGNNVGDGQVIPSHGLTFDPDSVDMPVWAPQTRSALAHGGMTDDRLPPARAGHP